MKECIKGAIIIYSCHKHINTRLKEFKLQKHEYNGWKVFYILGNPLISENYMIDNTIVLKCEDSYIHVAKKVVLGIKYINENYNVEEGILRCGDDLIFNEQSLEKFLNTLNKPDYIGVVANNNKIIETEYNNFMPLYYLSHQEDLQNPLHGIPYNIQDMLQFNKVPKLTYAGGVVVFLSKKSCDVLVAHFNNIQWNVFTEDKYGYPYIIEDIAIGYILHINNIHLHEYPLYIDNPRDFIKYNEIPIAIHTNKYK